jgi:DNA polymerase
MELEELREDAAKCCLCELYTGRKNPVFDKGSEASEILVVGMCPGPSENEVGIPFVGDAGKILDEILLNAFGFYSSSLDVYVTNLVKCFVPPGTKLEERWLVSCFPYFIVQLQILSPKVVIALGKDVCNFLLNNTMAIGEMRGRVFKYMGKKLICTYHPAYLARGGGIVHKHFGRVVEDFKLALEFL